MALSPLQPRTARAEETAVERQPNKTYEIDRTRGQIRKYIDGKQAIQQFVRKAVETARYRFLIYDDSYGSELNELIGEDIPMELLEEEIPRAIEEALIYDDRIEGVANFSIRRESDRLYIEFSVDTVEGVINEEVVI